MSVCGGGGCVRGWGGGENGSHAVHAALGGWAMCMRSRGSRAINTHCTKTVTPDTVRLFLICPSVRPSIHPSLCLSLSHTHAHTQTHIYLQSQTHNLHTQAHTHTHTRNKAKYSSKHQIKKYYRWSCTTVCCFSI